MAIINRDLSSSQQKDIYDYCSNVQISTGASILVAGPIPYPYVLESMQGAALGVSGAPVIRPLIARFIAGSGYTVIPCGFTNLALYALGTSGINQAAGPSLFSAGSTLCIGLSGDVLSFDMTGSNSAVTQMTLEFILRKSQDIVQYYGVSP